MTANGHNHVTSYTHRLDRQLAGLDGMQKEALLLNEQRKSIVAYERLAAKVDRGHIVNADAEVSDCLATIAAINQRLHHL